MVGLAQRWFSILNQISQVIHADFARNVLISKQAIRHQGREAFALFDPTLFKSHVATYHGCKIRSSLEPI